MQRAFGVEFALVREGNSPAHSTIHCATLLSCVTQVPEFFYNIGTFSVANHSCSEESRRAGSPLANRFLTMSVARTTFFAILPTRCGSAGQLHSQDIWLCCQNVWNLGNFPVADGA